MAELVDKKTNGDFKLKISYGGLSKNKENLDGIAFVVAGVHKDISVQDVFVGAAPFFVADVVTIAVLVAFPGIVLWLPNFTSY